MQPKAMASVISTGWEIAGHNMTLTFGDGVFRRVLETPRTVCVWALCPVDFGYIVFGSPKMVNHAVLSDKSLKSRWMFKRSSKAFKDE